MYDYLIVGSGLFGAVFAHEATQRGKKCLVIERRSHIGGNVYTERLEQENYQGNAVVNYTSHDVAYTRIIEHKHFAKAESPVTYITKEYPFEWKPGDEPYYPVNDARNNALYRRYAALAQQEPNVIFGGRLGSYKYYDMDKVIAAALDAAEKELTE